MSVIIGRTTTIPSFSVASGFLPETNAVLKRGKDAGFTLPSKPTQKAMNTLIGHLLDSGFWATDDLLLNHAYNDLTCRDFSRINWKNPEGNLATYNGGLLYTVNGVEGNGLNAYVGTGFNPSTDGVNYTLNNAARHFIQYKLSGTLGLVARTIDGVLLNTSSNRLLALGTNAQSINASVVLPETFTFMQELGLKGIIRDSAGTCWLYNKLIQSPIYNVAAAQLYQEQLLLRRGTSYGGENGISFYMMGGAQDFNDLQLLRTYYNEYLTTIGLTAYA